MAVSAVVVDRDQGIDTFEEGLEKIRKATVARINQAMSRLRLLQQLAQGDSNFDEWSK